MKPRIVSAVAVILCFAILAVAGLFGYSRYKAAQAKDAEFRAQLQNGPQAGAAAVPTHMPEQLSQHPNSGDSTSSQ
jgi:type II secretory pathway pseudopilin PulG